MRHQNDFVYILMNHKHTVLIHFEAFTDPRSAIAREKQLKRWRRSKKEALIAKSNPGWRDLVSEMWAVK